MDEYGLALAGGILIGLASAGLMLFNGRVAGISGILDGLLDREAGNFAWRSAFTAGLLVIGLVMYIADPGLFAFEIQRSPGSLILAGLLVGAGTRLGSGCTSGHGICGMGRFSRRSISATITFVITGVVTAVVVGQVFGGAV